MTTTDDADERSTAAEGAETDYVRISPYFAPCRRCGRQVRLFEEELDLPEVQCALCTR